VLLVDLDPDAPVVGPSGGTYCLRRISAKVGPEDALRDAGLVEVLRDPAEEERPAGAEDQARVDVGGLGDDALVEQVVDLVGDRLEHVLDDLLDACAARPRRRRSRRLPSA
jgi:hypothetical protein